MVQGQKKSYFDEIQSWLFLNLFTNHDHCGSAQCSNMTSASLRYHASQQIWPFCIVETSSKWQLNMGRNLHTLILRKAEWRFVVCTTNVHISICIETTHSMPSTSEGQVFASDVCDDLFACVLVTKNWCKLALSSAGEQLMTIHSPAMWGNWCGHI